MEGEGSGQTGEYGPVARSPDGAKRKGGAEKESEREDRREGGRIRQHARSRAHVNHEKGKKRGVWIGGGRAHGAGTALYFRKGKTVRTKAPAPVTNEKEGQNQGTKRKGEGRKARGNEGQPRRSGRGPRRRTGEQRPEGDQEGFHPSAPRDCRSVHVSSYRPPRPWPDRDQSQPSKESQQRGRWIYGAVLAILQA